MFCGYLALQIERPISGERCYVSVQKFKLRSCKSPEISGFVFLVSLQGRNTTRKKMGLVSFWESTTFLFGPNLEFQKRSFINNIVVS